MQDFPPNFLVRNSFISRVFLRISVYLCMYYQNFSGHQKLKNLVKICRETVKIKKFFKDLDLSSCS